MFNKDEKIILKGIGGFYYVRTADGIVETRAKGIFRKMGITPLAGDRVEIEESNGDYVVSHIYERSNYFVRPPAANVDKLFLVVSSVDPDPNLLVIDKLLAVAEKKSAKPVIVITKTDIKHCNELIADYRKSGFDVIDLHGEPNSLDKIKDEINGSLSVFSGNSGVGKSTLLTSLGIEGLETQQTSKKLGRGKHTTRSVEIYEIFGGYVADTPGFSSLDLERSEPIMKDELASLFTDFAPYIDCCEFRDCSHTVERGCAVIEAVKSGRIAASRHEDYVALYEAAKELNEWEIRK